MEDTTTWIAIGIGGGAFLIFVLVILVVICRRKCTKTEADGQKSQLVGSPSILSGSRYSSHIAPSPRSKKYRKRGDGKSHNGSVQSGFEFKPSDKKKAKQTVKSQRSSRSLPVMGNITGSRMDYPQQGTSYEFSIPRPQGPRSVYDYDKDAARKERTQAQSAPFGFNQIRLPSSGHINFAADGRFVVPEEYSHFSRHNSDQLQQPKYPRANHYKQEGYNYGAQNNRNMYNEPHNQGYSGEQYTSTITQPTQGNVPHPQQYQLRNSDLFRPGSVDSTAAQLRQQQTLIYQQYMNGTIQRAEYGQQLASREEARYSWTQNEGITYCSIIPAVFDRTMSAQARI